MPLYLRFRDLKARGIVNSWPSLKKRIDKFGFPSGRLIGPNARAWTEEEVEAWIAKQPTGPKPTPTTKRKPQQPRVGA